MDNQVSLWDTVWMLASFLFLKFLVFNLKCLTGKWRTILSDYGRCWRSMYNAVNHEFSWFTNTSYQRKTFSAEFRVTFRISSGSSNNTQFLSLASLMFSTYYCPFGLCQWFSSLFVFCKVELHIFWMFLIPELSSSKSCKFFGPLGLKAPFCLSFSYTYECVWNFSGLKLRCI